MVERVFQWSVPGFSELFSPQAGNFGCPSKHVVPPSGGMGGVAEIFRPKVALQTY